jgi:hypothetical protein
LDDIAATADLVGHCARYDFRFWGACAQMYHASATIRRGEIASGNGGIRRGVAGRA